MENQIRREATREQNLKTVEVLSQNKTVHIIDINDSDIVPTSSSTLIPVLAISPPSLPPGKRYHVFFSHSSEDREWVFQIVRKLESAKYGFKCCFSDRDFDIGVPVYNNIMKCVSLSKRTVIVMSPEFLKSPWCSYETRITFEMDLEARQRLLIPIMLRQCEVPEFIGRLSYIDVQNKHFWERFLHAIKDDDVCGYRFEPTVGSDAVMGFVPFQYNPNFFNTEIVTELTVYIGCNYCADSPAEIMPNELLRHGLQLTREEYKEIVNSISRICYIRCHGFYSRGHLLVIPVICAIGCAITFFISLDMLHGLQASLILNLCVWIITFVICLVVRYVMRKQAMNSLSKSIVMANRIAKRRHLMVSVKDYGFCNCACDRISIIFVYYDWRPCQTHMKQSLSEQTNRDQPEIDRENNRRGLNEDEPMLRPEAEQSSPTSQLHLSAPQIEERAENLLIQHATEYSQLMLRRRTKSPSEQRHTRQGECLCQFVESLLQSGETSCLDHLFRSRSRHR